MNNMSLADFEQEIKNFSIEELKKTKENLQKELSKMTLNPNIVMKIMAIHSELISRKGE